ncbi:coiled-coil domain-containing protein 142, partial [Asbolus verrucosus]
KLGVENNSHVITSKVKMWKDLLWKIKVKICYFIHELINEIAYLFIYYGEILLILTLRVSTAYNNLLSIDNKFVTRLLQILSSNRAELCCHKLIDCLLETYKLYDNNDDDNSSDNSSFEIYRALTKHMSPPDPLELSNKSKMLTVDNGSNNETFLSIEELISYEEKNVLDLLDIILKVAPAMLGNDGIKKSKTTGDTKISRKAREKVLDYYEQILWGEVGNFLEHIILWWASSPLSARSPHSSQHLREWITQFIPTAEIPPMVLSALTNLADALGVHVALTSWDQHFRLALVASKSTFNLETGKLFCNVLQDLVMLCNQCEVTPDWIMGAPLEELPLVEQIPVLHRLDHSIHTTRLWAASETKKIANNWNVDVFFMITHSDIVNCLSQLNSLRFTDHTTEIEKGGLGVHVQETPNECVKGLASICRTISLANLQMIFPENSYWRRIASQLPDKPSSYVDKYLDRILTPVLVATDDHIISNMILQIMCESWLDHIYINKIKFSQYGACQLLCDFGYIETWLMNCSVMSQTMRKKMMKNEVLRRCEGVGRLLLRCPGEQIKMIDKSKRIKAANSPTSEKNELMPAEMYVPNQEQWLELRAIKKKNLFASSLCCGKF